jgi:outer membrane protein assembly factor BamB
MKLAKLVLVGMVALGGVQVFAQDWPQWRGVNRDGKAAGFKAPKSWPKELKQVWKKSVGTGDASPALVGNRLFVFSREGDSEVIRALNVADGSEVWQDKYETAAAVGAPGAHPGPRSSVTVADGKVVTLGVRGILSCLDAESGKVLWRKDEIKGWPQFFTASSPLVADGLVIAQLGGATNGAIVAYDLAKGEEKWKWGGDSPAYASPVLLKANGFNAAVVETDKNLYVLNLKDGRPIWQTPFAAKGMGGNNSSTPIVDGSTIIFSGGGRGTKAVKLEKNGDDIVANELWTNAERSASFNSPVLKDGLIYGISQQHEFFCLDAKDGKSLWNAPVAANQPAAEPAAAAGGGGGGRPRGNRTAGYGSIVDGGSVLLSLNPSGELIAFKPDRKSYEEVARIKVSETPTFAHLAVSGDKMVVKDQDSVALLSVN